MWEKFKESGFAKKCKELSHNGGFMFVFVCLLLTVAITVSVNVATNRAKKQYAEENSTGEITTSADVSGDKNNGAVTEKPSADNKPSSDEKETSGPVSGTVDAPVYNEDEVTEPVGGEIEELELSLPVVGTVEKGHDPTIQVWSETMGDYRVHVGVDIAAKEGTAVCAVADGTVEKVWDDALMGRCVAIAHGDEIYTFYKNLDATLADGITSGASVKRGQEIGSVGNTAISELADEAHVHLEMTVGGLAVDPLDYFSEEAMELLASAAAEQETN